MLIVETEILKKGDKILIKRLYKDVIFAGEAVEAIKVFYTHLKNRTDI